jgi:predicted Zn finger-like uncharacterized protein
MILACPACRTRYQVDDRAVDRPSGRAVRCANCGHSWHHLTPPPAAPRLRETMSPPPEMVPPLPITPRAAITAPPAPRRRHGAGLGWVFVLLLFVVALGVAYFGRDEIIAKWPLAARGYSLVGLAPDAPGAGLETKNVVLTRNVDGVIVEGDITNKTGIPRPVPQLRVVLRDASEKDVAVKIVDPPKPRLLPGETGHFVIAFMPASDAAVKVDVYFAPG